jgi:hypothetical protein
MHFVDWYCARAAAYIDAERAKASPREPARLHALAEG